MDRLNFPVFNQTGKIRIAKSLSRFEGRFSYDTNPENWIESANVNGTVTYLSAKNGIRLTIAGASGDKLVRQTKRLFFYNPDTVVHAAGAIAFQALTGLKEWWGLFTYLSGEIKDGYILRMNEGAMEFVKISNVTGTPVETVIPRSEWIDPMDGTGESGVALNFEELQMAEVEHTHYGGGAAILYFRYQGQIYPAALFDARDEPTKDPIIANPVLAAGYGIEAIANLGQSASLEHIGISVSADGEQNPLGLPFATSRAEPLSVSGGTWVPLLTIEPKLTFKTKPNIYGYIYGLSFRFSVASRAATIAIVKDATLTGATFTDIPDLQGNPITESMMERDIAATAITGGTPIYIDEMEAGGKLGIDVAEQDIVSVNSTGTETSSLTACAYVETNQAAEVKVSAYWREVR